MRVWKTVDTLAVAMALEMYACNRPPRPPHWVGDTWLAGRPEEDRFWQAVTRALQQTDDRLQRLPDVATWCALVIGPFGETLEAQLRQEFTRGGISTEALTQWVLFEILPIVKGAVKLLQGWATKNVAGFDALQISAEDWWEHAKHIALMLVHDACQCAATHAGQQTPLACARVRAPYHALAHWQPQEVRLKKVRLERFIYRAVLGAYGCHANALAQGMLYAILHHESGLRKVKVSFKTCADEGTRYEGETCPKCRRPFEPSRTPVKAVDWLVIAGVYEACSGWFACGDGRGAHYHRDPALRQCVLQDCAREGAALSKRATILWQRTTFTHEASPSPSGSASEDRWLIEVVQRTVATLNGWQRVWALALAREVSHRTAEALLQTVVASGPQLSAEEAHRLMERLAHGRQPDELGLATVRAHFAAHASVIAAQLPLPPPVCFPTVDEVKSFESTGLRALVREAVDATLHGRDGHPDAGCT